MKSDQRKFKFIARGAIGRDDWRRASDREARVNARSNVKVAKGEMTVLRDPRASLPRSSV